LGSATGKDRFRTRSRRFLGISDRLAQVWGRARRVRVVVGLRRPCGGRRLRSCPHIRPAMSGIRQMAALSQIQVDSVCPVNSAENQANQMLLLRTSSFEVGCASTPWWRKCVHGSCWEVCRLAPDANGTFRGGCGAVRSRRGWLTLRITPRVPSHRERLGKVRHWNSPHG
jgi:hypothetical protein